MKFSEIIDQATELLQRKGRVTYRVLKREFALNDEALEDLKEELIDAEHVATDEDGRILVWAGEAPSTEASDAPIVQPSAPIPSPDLSSPESHQLLQAEPTVVGERRQLTVMFCDLVGSTALSEKLDPEDLHALIRSYQEICAEVIQRYDGYIAQYLGDGLLIYFGYPAAHEDDAQRAVRAGLEIPDQLHKLPSAHPLQVRIGIHTGQVVVGEIGEGDKREQLALGDTPNIAARVQGKAEPDAVIISAETYHLVQGWFECQDLGPQDLKGISAPLSLYRIQGESQAQSRFEVAIQTGLTPFVGREEEAELLRRLWVRAKGGDGQVVLVSGEAGIGKSRLLQVLSEAIGTEPHERVACRCSAFHQNSALYPIIDRLHSMFKFLDLDFCNPLKIKDLQE